MKNKNQKWPLGTDDDLNQVILRPVSHVKPAVKVSSIMVHLYLLPVLQMLAAQFNPIKLEGYRVNDNFQLPKSILHLKLGCLKWAGRQVHEFGVLVSRQFENILENYQKSTTV